jgi:cell division protease FtsH
MSGGGAGGPGGQIFNIGKSKAKLFDQNTEVKTTFKGRRRLGGCQRRNSRRSSIFLKNPKKYTVLGGKIPKGSLIGRFSWYRQNTIGQSGSWRG